MQAHQDKCSSRKAFAPVHIEYVASGRLRVMLYSIFLIAVTMTGITAILGNPWFAALYAILLPLARKYYLLHISTNSPYALRSLHRYADGYWKLVLRSGPGKPHVLLGDSIVLPYIMVLKFKEEIMGTTRVVIIMPDTIAAEAYRHTCAILLNDPLLIN